MYYIEILHKAVCYIEKHLEEKLTLEDVAAHIGYSPYHFDRIFKCYVGDSIMEYIRKRQMSEAAKLIASTNKKIVDIALKYHYNTRESFSRAFAKHYGQPPSAFRGGHLDYLIRDVMTYDYLLFQYNSIIEGIPFEIRHISSKQLYGKHHAIKSNSSKEIPLIWQHWLHNDCVDSDVCYGLCIRTQKGLDYFIGYEEKNTMETYSLKDNDYVCFKIIGPIVESTQKTWHYIYTRWFVEYEYEHTGDPDIEKYSQTSNGIEVELCVPIKKVRRS